VAAEQPNQVDFITPLRRKGRPARRSDTLPESVVTLVATLAIAIMAFTALHALVRHPDAALVKSDFAAFYCGSVVALAHKDPYALSPLQQCEAQGVDIPGGADPAAVGVDPDPLPGYNMAFFAPFTPLPYREAGLLWDLMLIAAIAGTAALLAAITGLPFVVIAAILAFTDGVLCITYGQLPPVLTFGLTLAAYGLVRDRRGLVLCGAGLSMIEPHVALPAFLAMLVWCPRMRLGLLAVALALAALSIAVLGVPLNLEYALVALPAHVHAEGTTSIQYSLTWLLHYVGVPDAAAFQLASQQYALFTIAALILAGPVARRLRTPAAIALFPPALALIGGTFIHLQQMAAAIPFGLVLATRLRGAAAATVWVAIALLAVPWGSGSLLVTLEVSTIVITVAFAALRSARVPVIAGVALVGIIAYAALTGPLINRIVPVFPRHTIGAAVPMPHALDGDRLASDEDAREVRTSDEFAVATPQTLAWKLPTWFALCAIAVVSLGALRNSGGGRPGPIPQPH
jgi:hypothetical protein